MRNILKFLLFVAVGAALVSCATVQPPFASSEEVTIKRELSEKLAEYRDLRITVSGSRVYLEGELQDKGELDYARGVALETPGVKVVMDNVFLTKVGTDGGDSRDK